jgi:hypothetical protein
MDATYAKDKLAADRIVLLGILIVGVLVARVIVSARSKIAMSSPITLDLAGLSIAMPSGEGWTCTDRWMHEGRSGENVYLLGGVFAVSAGRQVRTTTKVYCVCAPVAEASPAEEHFEETASQSDGKIVETGQIKNEGVRVDWARISAQAGYISVLCGRARLAYGRQFDIKVQEESGDLDWAWRVFKAIVCSMRVDEALLEAGNGVVEGVKSRGIGDFLRNQNRQRLFVVENARGARMGFTVDVIVYAGDEEDLPIQAARVLYLKGADIRERAVRLYAKDDLSRFEWGSQAVTMFDGEMIAGSSVEVSMNESGVLTATVADVQELEYRPGPLAVVSMLMDLVVVEMLEEGVEQCMIDMIDEDGQTVPVLLTQVSAEEAREGLGNENIEYSVRLEYQYLGKRDNYRLMYFDGEKRVLLEAVQRTELYSLKRADAEDVAREFPERADLVLRGDKLKERLGRGKD